MMQDNSDDFKNNPFKKLDRDLFPVSKTQAGTQKTAPAITKADQELFIRNVYKMQPAKAKKISGFTIGEQCQLPVPDARKKKSVSMAPAPKPPARPAGKDDEVSFLEALGSSVKPLGGQGRRIAKKPRPRAPMQMREPTLDDFMAGKLEFAISSTDEYMEGHVTGLDELLLNRLRAGQFSPEAHMDLHGFNLEQAFENLREFMRQAWLKDLRVVLIVPGRGKNSPAGYGILRQKLQTWLTREPFKRVVLAFCTAQPHDGGPGSIYVLLRHSRKKGRIQWNRIFIDSDYNS